MIPVQQVTLGDVFARAGRLYRDRPAVAMGDRRLTFGALDEQTDRLGQALRRRGIARGDRVALLSQNAFEYLVCVGAAAKLGAVLVPLNFRLQPAEVAYILADSGAKLIFTQPAFVAPLQGIRGELPALADVVVFGGEAPAGTLAYDVLVAEGPAEPARDPAVTEDDLVALMYTAAVEGRPRGAMLPHRAFVYQNVHMGDLLGITEHDVYANFLPMFHTMDIAFALACLHHGALNVIVERFDGPEAARLIAESKVSFMAEFAPMAGRILEAATENNDDLSSLRAVFGLDSPATVTAYLERYPGLVWFGGYGQTETHGLAAGSPIRSVAELEARPGMPGRPGPLNVVAIVDEEDRELPADGVGEIVVRGPNVAVGYWQLPEVTAHTTRHGWHHTGDLGRLDADGYLWFVDRKGEKELIKTGGENVYPAEVEAVLRQHPAVAAVCVLGVADPEWSEAVKAVVELRPGQAATAEELIGFCRERLASYKKPKHVQFVARLPRTASGEVDRAAAKQAYGDQQTTS